MPFPTIPAFNGGEISPSLHNRFDLEKFKTGAKTMLNFFCHAQGGFSNRPGTKFIGEADDSDYPHRVYQFKFSVTQAYCLVFGEGTMEVIYDGGYVQSGGSNYSLSTPYSADDIFGLRFVQSADTLYVSHPSYAPRKITRSAHDAWTITALSLSGPWLYNEGALGVGATLTSDYSGVRCYVKGSHRNFTSPDVGKKLRLGYPDPLDGAALKWRSGSILNYSSGAAVLSTDDGPYLTSYLNQNPGFDIGSVDWGDVSTGGASAVVTEVSDVFYMRMNNATGGTAIISQGPIPVIAGQTLRLEREGTVPGGGTVTIQVGTTDGAADLLNTTSSSGTFTPSVSYVYVRLTYTNSSNSVNFDLNSLILEGMPAKYSTLDWAISLFDETDEYPAVVGFFDQRLSFGGGNNRPQTVFHSVVGDYENFDYNTPYIDSDAIEYTLDSQEVNNIRWMAEVGELLIGTEGAIWRVSRGDSNSAFSATSKVVKRQAKYGCANIEALVVGSSILFVQRGVTKVRDLTYSLEADGYVGNDLTIFASHIFEDRTIVDWAYAENPDSIVWCVLDDGTLAALTYVREHKVFGWHRHETAGKYESVASVPEDVMDDVYFVVKRYNANPGYIGYLSTLEVASTNIVRVGATDTFVFGYTSGDTYVHYGTYDAEGDAEYMGTIDTDCGQVLDFVCTEDAVFILGYTGFKYISTANGVIKEIGTVTLGYYVYHGWADSTNGVLYISTQSGGIRSYLFNVDDGVTYVENNTETSTSNFIYGIDGYLFVSHSVNGLAVYSTDGVGGMDQLDVINNGNLFQAITHCNGYIVVADTAGSTYVIHTYSYDSGGNLALVDAARSYSNIVGYIGEYNGYVYVYNPVAKQMESMTINASTGDIGDVVDSREMDYYCRVTSNGYAVLGNANNWDINVLDSELKRCIEKMMPRITNESRYDFFFVDSGLSYDGFAATTFSGLDHLEGKTVNIVADGAVLDQQVVSGGQVVLDDAASVVHVGLPYTCLFESLDIDLTAEDGTTTQMFLKTIARVLFYVYRTRGFYAGPSIDDLYEVTFLFDGLGGQPPELFTGDAEIVLDSGHHVDQSIVVKTEAPVPVTILNITPEVIISEEII